METTPRRKRGTRRTKPRRRGMRMKSWRKSVSVACPNIILILLSFQSDSIFEPREAGAGDMSATDREIEQFKQFCLDSKYVSGIKMLSMTKQDDQVFYILDVLLRIASPFLAGLPRTVPRCLSMCATSPSRRKPDLELVFFSIPDHALKYVV